MSAAERPFEFYQVGLLPVSVPHNDATAKIPPGPENDWSVEGWSHVRKGIFR